MIASIPIGVAYFMWRRTRWTLAAVLGIVLLMGLVTRFASPTYQGPLTVALIFLLVGTGTHLLSVFTHGPTDFGARASGMPQHMLVLPARSRALVGWPMLYSALLLAAICTLVRLATRPDVSIIQAAAYVITLFAWFQLMAWFPFPIPVARGIATVSGVFGITLIVAAQTYLDYSPSTILATYAVMTLFAYGAALWGVRLARRGDGLEWRAVTILARLVPELHRQALRPFSSAARAHLWLELRRNALWMPLVVAAIAALSLPGGLGPDRPSFSHPRFSLSAHMTLLVFMLAIPVFLAGMFSKGLGKFEFWSGKSPTFNSFFSTRPMSTAQYVLIKFKSAGITTGVTWMVVVASLAIWFGLQRMFWPGEPIATGLSLGTWQHARWLVLAIVVGVFLTWRGLVNGLWITLFGRPWVGNFLSFGSAIAIGGGCFVGFWIGAHPKLLAALQAAAPLLIIGAVLSKLSLSVYLCNVLDCARLARRSVTLSLLGGSLGLAVLITIVVTLIYPAPLLVFCIVALLLPFNRMAAAPLALQLNRHRLGTFELPGRGSYAGLTGSDQKRGSRGFVKTIITVGVTLTVVGLLAGAMAFFRNAGPRTVEGTPVRVESVRKGTLIESVQAPGEVQPLTKVSISAKVASRIVEIPFKEGDQIKKGDVLVKLDSTDLDAALRSATARYAAQEAGIQVADSRVEAQKSTLDGLRATLGEAQLDFERQKGLLESRDVSQAVVDTAKRRLDEQQAALASAQHSLKAEESNLLVLKHQLEAADAEIARAREDLSYTTIDSPLDGVVTTINAKVGELVVTGTMNNPGTVIMEVADLSRMLVQARVDETDVAAVAVGQDVRVHMQAYPNRTFFGKVSSVALARTVERGGGGGGGFAMQDSRVFKVEVLLDTGQQRIFTGLTADVEVETKKHNDVIKVPSQAVLGRPTDDLPQAMREGNENVDKTKTIATVVYRFIDGKAVVTPVTVGPSDLSDTLIRSGLTESDRIITGPYRVLEGLTNDQQVKEETKATTQPATRPS